MADRPPGSGPRHLQVASDPAGPAIYATKGSLEANYTPQPNEPMQRVTGEVITGAQWVAERAECIAELDRAGAYEKKATVDTFKFPPAAVGIVLDRWPYWRGTLRYNELKRGIECGTERIGKAFLTNVEVWFQRHFLFNGATPEVCSRMVDWVARRHAYHPVRDYLTSLPPWDGNPRIENLVRVLSARVEETSLYQAYLRAWFTGAVKRVFEPGCQFDYMLVLYGKQGIRKSTFFNVLCGGEPFYNSLKSTKWDDVYTIHGSWVHEFAELEAVTTKSDVAALKAHITTRIDSAALKYEIQQSYLYRACVFCGTTNRDDILRDETGERRIWIIDCLGALDLAWVREHRDQLWAEAMMLYRSHEPSYLATPELEAAQAVSVSRFAQEDPWSEVIANFLAGRLPGDSIAIDDVFDHLKVPTDRWSQADRNRIGKELRKLGYTQKVMRINGNLVRRWVK